MTLLKWSVCFGIAILSFGANCFAKTATAYYTDSSFFDPRLIDKFLFDYSLDPVITCDTPSCVIPFSRAGKLILVKAKINAVEGNFILDTGSPNLVLNITYFRDYPTTQHSDIEQGGSTGTGVAVQRTSVDNFYFGSLKYARFEADLANLGHIENSKGVKILGLLGMKLLKQCEMIIDYEKSLIYLHLVKKKEAENYQHEMLKDTSTYNTVPIELYNDKILATTELGGKKLKLLIDCGAETNVLDSRLPNKVFENVVITGRVIMRGSGSQKVEALSGNLKSIKIGKENWGNLPVLIANLENTCLSYESCISGILGFDFLSLHKIGFNFVKRKMYIWK